MKTMPMVALKAAILLGCFAVAICYGRDNAISNPISAPTKEAPRLLLKDDFERNLPGPNHVIHGWAAAQPENVWVVPSSPLSNSRSMYFRFPYSAWRDNDIGRHDTITQSPSKSIIHATMGVPIWAGFSTYLEEWAEDYPSNGELFQQWHGAVGATSGLGPGGCSAPPVALYTRGPELTVTTNYSVTGDDRNIRPHRLFADELSRYVGVPTYWVMRVQFDYEKGTIDVWRNGEYIVKYRGPNIYRCAGQTTEKGPFFNFGIYKWYWGSAPSRVAIRSIYFDDIRIGSSSATCDDVKPPEAPPCNDNFGGEGTKLD